MNLSDMTISEKTEMAISYINDLDEFALDEFLIEYVGIEE